MGGPVSGRPIAEAFSVKENRGDEAMTPHGKRWVTGIVAVPLLFAVVAYGSTAVFAALIAFVSLMGMREYQRLVLSGAERSETAALMIAAALILLGAALDDAPLLIALLSFSVMVLLIIQLPVIRKGAADLDRVGRTLLGLLYVPLLMSHFILIRQTPEGREWVFFILVLAFAGDTAAFYVGKRFGKNKLLPEVSPGKTIEGVIGLVFGSIFGCLLFRYFFFPTLPLVHTVVLAMVGSLLGQLGDLCESALKRAAGVKDSGALLPGHGGILDRLDCLIFIAPYVYYYQFLILR
jgi:phosphatidate cytidylyltransferase